MALAVVPFSQAGMLERLADPGAALKPLPPGTRVVQASSHDLGGGNVDGGSYGGPVTTIGVPPNFVRREDGGYVLVELQRPGCLVRSWMTALDGTGDLSVYGRLQLFVDGEAAPRLDEPAVDFFGGRDPRFPRPLVGGPDVSSGGNYAYVPVCFARSLKVRVTGAPNDAQGWWQFTFLTAPPGARVEPFRGADARAGAAALTRAASGAPPARRPAVRARRTVAAGDTVRLARLRGAGTIRRLRIRIAPFDAATLAGLSLRVTADGARHPQVDVPLGAAFGDGLETRPVRTTAFGMDPARGEGWLTLPVPYRRGVTVALAARRAATVALDAWTGRRAPAGAGTLYGEHRSETTRQGTDVDVLDARGSGRLAALVYDAVGTPGTGGSGSQFFMEGDERVHVDGARSPSLHGTGTEDLFNAGFYYAHGAFSLPTHGAGPFVSREDGRGAQSQYRVFGPDGVRWGSSLAFGIEHGGGDERSGEEVASTTFSYRAAPTARRTGRADPGELEGATEPRALTAYFEGDRDGSVPVSTVAVGGFYYPAPPPEASPEGVAAEGVAFTEPVSATLRVDPRNRGVLLRRLTDQAPPLAPVAVRVDGRPAGIWSAPAATSPAKRWLEDDFALPAALTAGRRAIRVTLAPQGAPSALYALEAHSLR